MPFNHMTGYQHPRSILVSAILRERLSRRALGPVPSFLIIGTQRGGTTYLYDRLLDHPSVYPALVKEVHYFDRHIDRGMPWYQAHFSPHLNATSTARGVSTITGEATPDYLFHPQAARRVKAAMPDVKLIVLLRNPVERAYSHYQLMGEFEREQLSFMEAIQAESERIDHDYRAMISGELQFSRMVWNHSYVTRGIYADQLPEWMEHFPKDQLLVVSSEEFFREPRAILESVSRFLGLADWEPDVSTSHRSLAGVPMPPAERAWLSQFYRPHNQRLFDLLGVNYGWND